MAWLPVLGTIVGLLAGWIYWYGILYFKNSYLKKMGLEGPQPTPFLGNFPDLFKGYHLVHEEWRSKWGDFIPFFQGRAQCVLLSDLDLIKQVMVKSFDTWHNRPRPAVEIRRNTGLVFARDDVWKRVRRTLSPSFNAMTLKAMLPMMADAADVFTSKAMRSAKSGEVVDISAWFGQLTMDVIGSTSFGMEFESQESGGNKFTQAAFDLFKNSASSIIGSILSASAPFLVPLLKFFPTQVVKEAMKARHILETASMEIIKERRQNKNKKEDENKDVLDLLLSAKDKETGNKLSGNEVIDQCITFLLAGHETTATTLACMAFLLAENPKVQDEVIRLVDEKVGDRKPTYEDLKEFDYLDHIINETLRIYPTIAVLIREADRDCEVGSYKIKKGTQINIPIYAIHKDPKIWDEPEKFKPERFTKEESEKRHPGAFMPFGMGPRICIGMRFAIMEMKITLIHFYQKAKFVLPDGRNESPLPLRAGITMSPKNGVWLQIESRNK